MYIPDPIEMTHLKIRLWMSFEYWDIELYCELSKFLFINFVDAVTVLLNAFISVAFVHPNVSSGISSFNRKESSTIRINLVIFGSMLWIRRAIVSDFLWNGISGHQWVYIPQANR